MLWVLISPLEEFQWLKICTNLKHQWHCPPCCQVNQTITKITQFQTYSLVIIAIGYLNCLYLNIGHIINNVCFDWSYYFYSESGQSLLELVGKTCIETILSLALFRHYFDLTLYLLVSYVDNFCKQFGPRSGPTFWSGSKLIDTLIVFLK